MKKNTIILLACAFLFGMLDAFAQSGDPKKDLEKLKAMLDQINTDPQNPTIKKPTQKTGTTNANTQGAKASPSMPSKYSRNPGNVKYSKSTIDNAYKFLTDAEKEKVKNLPEVPEALRTNVDAEVFLEKLKGQDINLLLQQSAKDKSMPFLGYCLSYQSLITKAQYIVSESKKLKAEFLNKNGNIDFGKNIGKTYVSENSLVYLPFGDASFADQVIAANYTTGNLKFPENNCLSNPDFVEGKKISENKGIYSLGLGGSLLIRFDDNALVDANGPDLFVFEAGAIEPTQLEISKDGKTWINVGKIEGGTAFVDIHDFVKPNEYFYYVKLTDLQTQSTVAGADIDAIASIGAAMQLSLNAEVLFDIGSSTLKPSGIDAVKQLAQNIKTITQGKVVVEGHTDDIGDATQNDKLSLARAKTVSELLQKELTNNKFTFQEIGKGETEPKVANTNDDNRKKNRRVEIVIIPN